jgi:Zn-finger nucleic acid-binding protein
MNCPNCAKSELTELKVKGQQIRLDVCSGCKGLWFDRKELETLLKISVKRLKIPSDARKQSRYCPRCQRPLYAFCYPLTMVIVDMCAHCEGIWLDANEFKEIKTVYLTSERPDSQNRKIVCPKCGHSQDASNECLKCGIIFSKYRAKPAAGQPPHKNTAKPNKREPSDSFKGRLLDFIDKSLDVLSA